MSGKSLVCYYDKEEELWETRMDFVLLLAAKWCNVPRNAVSLHKIKLNQLKFWLKMSRL